MKLAGTVVPGHHRGRFRHAYKFAFRVLILSTVPGVRCGPAGPGPASVQVSSFLAVQWFQCASHTVTPAPRPGRAGVIFKPKLKFPAGPAGTPGGAQCQAPPGRRPPAH
eukprot:755615-Hanusia_phi.AAC.2